MLRTSAILAIIILITTAFASALEIPRARLKVQNADDCYIPYISNYPLHQKNDKIQHVILAIHSSNHDATAVYNNCIELINARDDLNKSTLIITPQFLMEKHVENNTDSNLLFWKTSPFWGSSTCATKSADKDLRISAYSILAQIISEVCSKTTFPNVQRLTILGHSAGGQLVNRFAASNTVEFDIVRPAGVHCRYIVMNSSSYVYFSPKRSVNGSIRDFSVPPPAIVKSCPGYNNYGYGLDSLYSYHREKGLTAEKIRQTYPQRNVIYLLGEKDCVPDKSMSTNPSAMLQGRNRLERGRIYYEHLIDEFGPEIKKKQKLVVVPETGHSGRQMILSKQGRLYILKP
jgi:hypothetical protein